MGAQPRGLVQRLFTSLQHRDAEGMIACYHPRVRFEDPVFGVLDYAQVSAMWRMLCERGHDLSVTFDIVGSDAERPQVIWDARYTFGKTGRKVQNHITSKFEFLEGLISRQRDVFDVWRWSRMALGPMGALAGWTPMVRSKIRKAAASDLRAFMAM